jgi:hypothetical protein
VLRIIIRYLRTQSVECIASGLFQLLKPIAIDGVYDHLFENLNWRLIFHLVEEVRRRTVFFSKSGNTIRLMREISIVTCSRP